MMSIFSRAHYETLNEIRIYADHFKHNIRVLREYQPNKKIAIILKSNAYGHGLKETARVCDRLGATFFAVDSTYEALAIRDMKLRTPILVLGYTHEKNLRAKKYPFTFVANSLDSLKLLLETQKTPIHLFINTGMNREGIEPHNISRAINIIGNNKQRIEGICTHFFEADIEPITRDTLAQQAAFQNTIQQCTRAGITFTHIHADASNSAAHMKVEGNLIRAGRILYGAGNDHELYKKMKPTCAFISHIVDIRILKKGERIGYNGTFTAPHDMNVALIPAGYQEGVHRNLSNKGIFLVKNIPCRILGRVSMNYTSIDISHTHASVDDEVIIYSQYQTDQNSIVNAAKTAETIEHELLCYLSPTVRRVIKYNE